MSSVPPFGPGTGWGFGPWGKSAGWGDGFFGQPNASIVLKLTQVYAASRRHVFVAFNNLPLMKSGFGATDVLNPNNWVVTRTDTGTVLSIGGVIPGTQAVTLYLLDVLGGPAVNHTVSVQNIVTSGGAPFSPAAGSFIGTLNSSDSLGQRPRRPVTRDLFSRPLGDGRLGSTLAVGSNGDYTNQQGLALVKKLVERRLFTKKGSFTHLQNYGLGFSVKEPLPTGDLVRLKQEIEEQVLEEPEIVAVIASLLMDSTGTLTITLTGKTKAGLSFELTLAAPTGTVAL